jgi:hypothetical protein
VQGHRGVALQDGGGRLPQGPGTGGAAVVDLDALAEGAQDQPVALGDPELLGDAVPRAARDGTAVTATLVAARARASRTSRRRLGDSSGSAAWGCGRDRAREPYAIPRAASNC